MGEARQMTVVALCNCGCDRVVYASAPDYADERELGKMAREGYAIRQVPVEWARAAEWFCAKRAAEKADTPERRLQAKYDAALAEMRSSSTIEQEI